MRVQMAQRWTERRRAAGTAAHAKTAVRVIALL